MPDAAPNLWGLVLAGARVTPLCVLVAAFTRTLVPWPVALSLGLSLAVALAGAVAAEVLAAVSAFTVLRELLLGLAFALATLLPVLALSFSARMAELLLPLAPRPGPLSTLYAWLSALTFFALSGHRAVVMGLSATVRDVPLGTGGLDGSALAFGVACFFADALAFALALALPLLAALWIAGAVVALVARALRLPATLDGSLRLPLLVLLGGALAAPLLSRVPEAMRAGLAAARSVVERIAH